MSATVAEVRREVAALRAERDALVAALDDDDLTHEFEPYSYWNYCTECNKDADAPVHRTSRVVLASLTAARPVAEEVPR